MLCPDPAFCGEFGEVAWDGVTVPALSISFDTSSVNGVFLASANHWFALNFRGGKHLPNEKYATHFYTARVRLTPYLIANPLVSILAFNARSHALCCQIRKVDMSFFRVLFIDVVRSHERRVDATTLALKPGLASRRAAFYGFTLAPFPAPWK